MILSQDKLDIILDYFLKNPSKYIQTMSMTKLVWKDVDSDQVRSVVNSIINEIGFEDYHIIGDNYFLHSRSYFPHCDLVNNSNYNVLIPLHIENPKDTQNFIIFDQLWLGESQTWVGNLETKNDFIYNKLVKTRPYDSDLLEGKTHNSCPNNIIGNMDMTYLTEEYLFGLSGRVIPWIPGHIIVFDSKHIHATGKMQCDHKIGLSLRIKNHESSNNRIY